MAGMNRPEDSHTALSVTAQDLYCFLCSRLAQDPQQTSCGCVELYCRTCFQKQREKSELCPTCNYKLSVFSDRLSARRIEALHVSRYTERGSHREDQPQLQQHSQETLSENVHNIGKKTMNNKQSEDMTTEKHTSQSQYPAGVIGRGTEDDLIMLYLPCFIICAMMVCIVSSAFALGHV